MVERAAAASSAPAGSGDSGGETAVDRAVARFQQGDDRDAAFRFLYETFQPPLRRFFARQGVPPEQALDLTQTTMLRVYKGLEGYEDRQHFTAWLYRVARNTLFKARRRSATAKRSAVEISHDQVENPEAMMRTEGRQLDEMIDGERRAALAAAVEELPEQMRDCLTLRLYHQLSYREIAKVKKLSSEAVKAHLFRARKRLRERLSGFDLGDDGDEGAEP
ncbi:MAG TPA: sigma-70 family RNA polymerase sigma factor [Thermoanaerobaculia bacterium]|nr:sigma-70 family RNA polymerase sigma factor [Thermoanaerobaculia bacterium]